MIECSAERIGSLSSWRAWIEIVLQLGFAMLLPSLSSWRAWIEISSTPSALLPTLRRSPHGERGLKSRGIGLILYDAFCRSPHGERGLKSRVGPNPTRWHRSLSSWRAWIEIGVCIVLAAAWMLLSLFMSSVPRTCGIPHVRDC